MNEIKRLNKINSLLREALLEAKFLKHENPNSGDAIHIEDQISAIISTDNGEAGIESLIKILERKGK